MIVIPKAPLNIARSEMPQIKPKHLEDFLEYLINQKIDFEHLKANSHDLKPSQSEFDIDKVEGMMKKDELKGMVIVSRENQIIDGHHRWLAAYNSVTDTYVETIRVDMNILDLLAMAKLFDKTLFHSIDDK